MGMSSVKRPRRRRTKRGRRGEGGGGGGRDDEGCHTGIGRENAYMYLHIV